MELQGGSLLARAMDNGTFEEIVGSHLPRGCNHSEMPRMDREPPEVMQLLNSTFIDSCQNKCHFYRYKSCSKSLATCKACYGFNNFLTDVL